MALNIFNYRYQHIPYVKTKGIGASNVIVPSFNRPSTNKDYSITAANDYSSPFGKARPLKHWRLQLNNNTKSSNKASIAALIDRPGQTINLATNETGCLDNPESNFVKQYILTDFVIQRPIPSDKFDDLNKNTLVCVACNPENNVIKSAVSLLNKDYYTDTSAYLKSRVKTFNQLASFVKKPDIQYIDPETGVALYPSDTNNGPQDFNTTQSSDKCVKAVRTIYKPNNSSFAQQGAVDGGSRIARLKYDTITKNGASFRTAYGQQGANAGKYSSSPEAPFFLKSKVNVCKPFHRNGNKTTNCMVFTNIR